MSGQSPSPIVVAVGHDPVDEAPADLLRQAGEDWLVDVTDGISLVDGPSDERQRGLAGDLGCTVAGFVGLRFVSTLSRERRA